MNTTFHRFRFRSWCSNPDTNQHQAVIEIINLYDVEGYGESICPNYPDNCIFIRLTGGYTVYAEIGFEKFDKLFTEFTKQANNSIVIDIIKN